MYEGHQRSKTTWVGLQALVDSVKVRVRDFTVWQRLNEKTDEQEEDKDLSYVSQEILWTNVEWQN